MLKGSMTPTFQQVAEIENNRKPYICIGFMAYLPKFFGTYPLLSMDVVYLLEYIF
jgi:hypothetical protein